MKNTLLGILIGTLISPLVAFAIVYPASNSLAPNPQNGYVFTTNGATSSWTSISGAASTTWGQIIGTLSSQTDLQTALNAKLSTTSAAATYLPLSASTSLAYIPFASSTLYVPYTGAFTTVNLNSQALTNVATLSVGTTSTSGLIYVLASSTGQNSAYILFTATSSSASQFTILGNGNVGIGVTAPTAKLDLWSSSGSDIFRISSTTGNTRLLTFTAGGNLGIGSSSPVSLLSVMASSTAQTSPFISFNSTTSPIFNVLTNGKVGIGTSTPQQTLDMVAGGAYGYNGLVIADASTTLNNYFFGNAGNLTMTGTDNTGSGYNSLNGDTSGSYDAGTGYSSLQNNTTGNSDTANGEGALLTNTTGSNNVAVGQGALQDNSTSSNNTAIGQGALGQMTSTNSTGGEVALGYLAGYHVTTSSNELFINNQDRSSYTGDQTKSLIYGVFNSATSSQSLTINGTLNTFTVKPTCIEMQDMATTAIKIDYMYASNTAMVVTSSKPSFCN